ncbi:MAG: substrate-binding domain-containing protein [Anaerolineales bacterium]|nr:substrate-binding domain-containing protein [Anaerolineales bacterium]
MKRVIWIVVLLLVPSLVLAACAPAVPVEEPAVTPEEPAAPAVDEEYIYVSCMGNLEFFNAHKYGMKWAGEVLGVKTDYVGPAEYDMAAMVAAFDGAIARNPAGIVVFAVEPVLEPTINEAVAAGIPVVTILGDLPDSDRLAFVGSNQFDLGYVGGKNIAEALGGEGQIAILSIPGVKMFDDREEGFRAAFVEYPGIEVVGVGDTKADTVTAISVATDMLTRHPDLDAFVGTDSTGGIGAATAVEETGLVGEVLTVAMDRNSDVLEKILAGTLTGTVAQDDAAMPFWAVLTLYHYNHNQAPLTIDNEAAGARTGPSVINTYVNYIDETNAEHYLEANEIYMD